MENGNGAGRSIHVKLGSLVAIGAILLSVLPVAYWAGTTTSRISTVEKDQSEQQALSKAKFDLLIENDKQLRVLFEMHTQLVDTVKDVSARVTAIEVDKGRSP